jgi:hypothetical protein
VEYINQDLYANELWLKGHFLVQEWAKGEVVGSKPTLDAFETYQPPKNKNSRPAYTHYKLDHFILFSFL